MTESKNKVVFDEKEYDVSISMGCFATVALISFGGTLCAPYKTILILDAEEVTKNDTYVKRSILSVQPHNSDFSLQYFLWRNDFKTPLR